MEKKKNCFTSEKCLHSQNLADDRTGDIICILCGLVLEPLFAEQEHARGGRMESATGEGEVAAFMRDVAAQSHISARVVDLSLSYFHKIRQRLESHRPKFTAHILAAYCLYEISSKEGVSRTVEEIAYFAGCSTNKLWSVESALNLEETLNSPSDYVDRYCNQLEMSYAQSKEVHKVLDKLPFLQDMKPQSAVATAIRYYCVENKSKLSLRSICEACNVSPANIQNAIRKISAKQRC
jgi:transcription initiation factor TFIIIB Brf1 subunit/transcription initiation factor TFIIB